MASINFTVQRNNCKVSRAEFRCDSGSSVFKTKVLQNILSPAVITDLEAFTDYKCAVRVENSIEEYGGVAKYSPFSYEETFKTKEGGKALTLIH
jgi:hypothetical protein